MNISLIPFLKLIRKVYTFFFPNTKQNSLLENIYHKSEYSPEQASNLIRHMIESKEAFIVGRLGIELFTMLNYKETSYNIFKFSFYFIIRKLHFTNWENNNISNLCIYSGFFPNKLSFVKRFSKLMINILKEVDVWGYFSSIELEFNNELQNSKKIRLKDIDPFFVNNPWTKALKDKNVLVIHPFADTIKKQYKNRSLLFENSEILPEFNLFTIKAVQTIAYNTTEFSDWFEALNFMKSEVDKIEFDVAIIGCGAYSLALCSYVKEIGKGAIYLGGSTQILFGIKGNRWEKLPEYNKLFNNYWVRPNSSEHPNNSEIIEDACYW